MFTCLVSTGYKLSGKVGEARLGWFWHVRRRDGGYAGQQVSKMEVPCKEEEERKTTEETGGCREGGRGLV